MGILAFSELFVSGFGHGQIHIDFLFFEERLDLRVFGAVDQSAHTAGTLLETDKTELGLDGGHRGLSEHRGGDHTELAKSNHQLFLGD